MTKGIHVTKKVKNPWETHQWKISVIYIFACLWYVCLAKSPPHTIAKAVACL